MNVSPYKTQVESSDGYFWLPETNIKEFEEKGIVFGIQGGAGSFNEEAVRDYIEINKIENYKINYLYTTENVLEALDQKKINLGHFAIYNSIGGIVGESVEAIRKHNFKVIDSHFIKVSQTLMIRQDAELSDITTIITHPMVLAQCKHNLETRFPQFKLIPGENEYIDQAMVAKSLDEKVLPKEIATVGSAALIKLYKLKVMGENLQDRGENYTTFLHVVS